jgi:hypothetical protein
MSTNSRANDPHAREGHIPVLSGVLGSPAWFGDFVKQLFGNVDSLFVLL